MRKLTYIIHSLQFAGAERLVLDLVNILKNNYDISIISVYQSQDTDGKNKIEKVLKELGIKHISLNKKIGSSKYKTLFLLNKVIKELDPDIIHAHTLMPNIYSGLRNILFSKIPTITTIHSGGNDWSHKSTWYLERMSIAGVSKIVTVSSYVEEMYKSILKLKGNKKIITIENGINTQKFNDVDESLLREKKKKLGIRNNEIVLINVARVVPNKGQRFLLEVLSKLDYNYKLLIVGNLENMEFYCQLKREISERGLGDRVLFLGSRDDVNELLRISDIFVFPSYYEASGIALMEAMYTNKKIISSPLPTAKDFSKNYEDIHIAGFDSDIWAQKIREINNKNNKNKRNFNNKEFYYSIERVALAYSNLYLELLKKK
ncbi:glycosyltransferase [Geobacillus zalihae]|uniref:glycosyltransferase n=1 Tax=Geobacillus zalihae TaxID=213419 RepID=UPI001680E3E0|nr:glycosyltransferase [Geobacillus zalihae]QNU23482.1 glycosyltransferase [Geobacillus zalihae]